MMSDTSSRSLFRDVMQRASRHCQPSPPDPEPENHEQIPDPAQSPTVSRPLDRRSPARRRFVPSIHIEPRLRVARA